MSVALVLALTLVQVAPSPADSLFLDDGPLVLRLEADLATVRGDRRGDPEEVTARFRVPGFDGREAAVEGTVRARGNFRRESCPFPPLRFEIRPSSAGGTPLTGQEDLKLVVPCRPGSSLHRQYVLEEYLLYRAYELLTDLALRVRLAEVTFVDTSGEDEPFTAFSFLIENEDRLADRLDATVLDLPEGKNIRDGVIDPMQATLNAVFMFMIGNTDWSDVAGHNVELLATSTGRVIPIPYDFDMSGIIDANYATVDPDLGLRSVRERVYRGFCANDVIHGAVLDRFRSAQEAILGLYGEFDALEEGRRNRTLSYLDEFFRIVQNDDVAERRIFRGCRRP